MDGFRVTQLTADFNFLRVDRQEPDPAWRESHAGLMLRWSSDGSRVENCHIEQRLDWPADDLEALDNGPVRLAVWVVDGSKTVITPGTRREVANVPGRTTWSGTFKLDKPLTFPKAAFDSPFDHDSPEYKLLGVLIHSIDSSTFEGAFTCAGVLWAATASAFAHAGG